MPTVLGVAAPPALAVPPGLVSCRALLAYDDHARLAITSLKNRDRRDLVSEVADGLAALVPAESGIVLTWAPTSARRRRQRGFDQAELLARAVARRWGVPCHGLLARRAGPPQTGRSLADRRAGPLLLARAGSRVAASAPVVIVDDVLTTGSTLTAATRALAVVDVGRIVGLTAARTPRRGAAPPCVLPLPQKVEKFAQVPVAASR